MDFGGQRNNGLVLGTLVGAAIVLAACGQAALSDAPAPAGEEAQQASLMSDAKSEAPVSEEQAPSELPPLAQPRPEVAPASSKPSVAGAVLVPTRFAERLRDLKLDPAALPPLEKLSSIQRYKLMPLFEQSLGKQCEDCHEGEDYEKETTAKNLTRRMWNELTRPFQLQEGPVFCDSCHQGSSANLDRDADVAAYMKVEYGGRLLTDGKPAKCSTCHGDEFEPDLFESVWGK